MPKSTHTALKDAARELADVEGLSYAAARRIVERWAAHEGPTDDELRAADETEFDPLYYYACQPGSSIPGFLMRMHDYPERSEAPATYCHPHPVQSLADPEKTAILSLTARPDVYCGEPALVVEPVTYTPPPGSIPGFGHWANCWTIHLHDVGFLDRISNLATPGWSATVTRGVEPSAPSALRLAHADGYVLFDTETPLPPDWLARVRCNPEGVPVVCGPGAGRPVPPSLDDADYVNDLLDTLDLVAARIPFTVEGA